MSTFLLWDVTTKSQDVTAWLLSERKKSRYALHRKLKLKKSWHRVAINKGLAPTQSQSTDPIFVYGLAYEIPDQDAVQLALSWPPLQLMRDVNMPKTFTVIR